MELAMCNKLGPIPMLLREVLQLYLELSRAELCSTCIG